MLEGSSIVQEKINKILENIDYAKKEGMQKLSAILALEGNETEKVKKELVGYFVGEGYRVSLIKSEVEILVIEW